MNKQSKKQLIVLGLFVFAFLWVGLMWLLDPTRGWAVPPDIVSGGSGGSSGGGPKASRTFKNDGTIKTDISRFTRDRAHVSMNVNVTDKDGKPVTDLRPNEEFQVFEDGKKVNIKDFTPASQTGAIRLALVVEYGPYSGKADRELTQAGIENLLKKLQDADQFGLYLNNHYYLATGQREGVPMGAVTQERRDRAVKLMDNILAYQSGGGILKTMGMALSKLAEVKGRRILVVVSNGHDDFHDIQIAHAPTKDLRAKYMDDHKKVISDITSSAKNKWNIPIYMLNPSTGGREDVCKQLASETGGEYHICPTTGKMTDTLVRITEKVRDDYLVEYDSPNPALDGNERKVDVVIKSGESLSTAQEKYRVEGVVKQGGSGPNEEASSSGGGGGGFKSAVGGIFRVIWQFAALALLLALLFAAPYFLWLGAGSGDRSAPAAAAPQAPPADATSQAAKPTPRAVQAAQQLLAQKPEKKGSSPAMNVPNKGSAPAIQVPKKGSAPE